MMWLHMTKLHEPMFEASNVCMMEYQKGPLNYIQSINLTFSILLGNCLQCMQFVSLKFSYLVHVFDVIDELIHFKRKLSYIVINYIRRNKLMNQV